MRSIFKKISLVLASLMLLSNVAVATEIGIISMQEISVSSAIAKAAEAELNKTFSKDTEALEKEAKALQAKIAEFQKQAPALSEKARNDKAAALDKEGRKFEEKRIALSQKIAPRQQEMQAEMIEIIREASQIYARDNKLDAIIDGTNSVIVTAGSADITKGIIVEMDKIWAARGSKFKN